MLCGAKNIPNVGENTEGDEQQTLDISKNVTEIDNEACEAMIEEFSDLSSNVRQLAKPVNQYVGGYVTMKINEEFQCDICTPLLYSDTDLHSFIHRKEYGTLNYPSQDVVNILMITDSYMIKFYDTGKLFNKNDILKVLLNISMTTVLSEYPSILKTEECKYFLRVHCIIFCVYF